MIGDRPAYQKGDFLMVESAPLFIEYYCVGYMHIEAVTALCICSFVAAVFAMFLSSLFWRWLDKGKSE